MSAALNWHTNQPRLSGASEFVIFFTSAKTVTARQAFPPSYFPPFRWPLAKEFLPQLTF